MFPAVRKAFANEDVRDFSIMIGGLGSLFSVVGVITWLGSKMVKADAVRSEQWKTAYMARLESWCLGEGSHVIVRATSEEAAQYNHYVREKNEAAKQAHADMVAGFKPPKERKRLLDYFEEVEELADYLDTGYRKIPVQRTPYNPTLELIRGRVREAIRKLDAEHIPNENFDGYLIRVRSEEVSETVVSYEDHIVGMYEGIRDTITEMYPGLSAGKAVDAAVVGTGAIGKFLHMPNVSGMDEHGAKTQTIERFLFEYVRAQHEEIDEESEGASDD